MRKILACTLFLSILLGCATATAQSRKERRAKRKAKTEKQASKSTHTPVSVKPEKTVTEKTTVQQTEPYCPELNRNLTPAQIDSLVALWREKQTLQSYDTFFNDYIDIDSLASSSDTTPDSVYANRLRALVSPVQLPFNPIVKNYIRRYVDTRYGTINRVLSLSRYYFPLIEEELIKADLPVELRALPIIESALSTTATSPMGAVGLWQFMPATGKSYGLEINSFVDERRDPVQATRAACRYLKDLYGIYHDWTLAIAAYNCGPGQRKQSPGPRRRRDDLLGHLRIPAPRNSRVCTRPSSEPPMPMPTTSSTVSRAKTRPCRWRPIRSASPACSTWDK